MVTIAYHQILKDELQRLEELDPTPLQDGDRNDDEMFRFWASYYRMF